MQPNKTDRRHTLRNQIEEVLKAHPEGLSVSEITARITWPTGGNGVRRSLLSLSSAYVARWAKSGQGPYHAVWCLSDKCMVDCPKPAR